MWLYCPKCQKQKDVGDYSLYYICRCSGCGHKFRGIHAKMNLLWHSFRKVLTTQATRIDTTCCIYCGQNVTGNRDGTAWPSVCPHCTRDLPTQSALQTDTVDL